MGVAVLADMGVVLSNIDVELPSRELMNPRIIVSFVDWQFARKLEIHLCVNTHTTFESVRELPFYYGRSGRLGARRRRVSIIRAATIRAA